ncbi:hypothetical protein ACOME3_009945 [Neoechinorhynchus agilis]
MFKNKSPNKPSYFLLLVNQSTSTVLSQSLVHSTNNESIVQTNNTDQRFYEPLRKLHEADCSMSEDVDLQAEWLTQSHHPLLTVTESAAPTKSPQPTPLLFETRSNETEDDLCTNGDTSNFVSTIGDHGGSCGALRTGISPPSKRRAALVDHHQFHIEYTVSHVNSETHFHARQNSGPNDFAIFGTHHPGTLGNIQPVDDPLSGLIENTSSYSTLSQELDSHLCSSTATTAITDSGSPFINESPLNFKRISSDNCSSGNNSMVGTGNGNSGRYEHRHSSFDPKKQHENNQVSAIACVVCSDKSSGKHYGQYTCEGCKSFFKRSVRRNMLYNCKGSKSCPVDQPHRNQCQYCRFQKCIKMGMKRDSVQKGRSSHQFLLMNTRKSSNNGGDGTPPLPTRTTSQPPPIINIHNESAINSQIKKPEYLHERTSNLFYGDPQDNEQPNPSETYLVHHNPKTRRGRQTAASYGVNNTLNTFSSSSSTEHRRKLLASLHEAERRDTQYDPEFSMEYSAPNIDSMFEILARLIFIVVRWARDIPAFAELLVDDRIALLRSTWSHMFLIKMAQCNLPFQSILPLSSESQEDVSDMNTIIHRIEKLRELNMNYAEYGCLKAAVLFSPGKNEAFKFLFDYVRFDFVLLMTV